MMIHRNVRTTALLLATLLVTFEAVMAADAQGRFLLLCDREKVVGCVISDQSYTGETVTVYEGKSKVGTFNVGLNNRICWFMDEGVAKRAPRLRLKLGKIEGAVMVCKPSESAMNAFFILERGVYRPGQEMKFAALLTRASKRGSVVPAPNETVKIQIRSKAKSIRVANLELTSDAQGLVEGRYRIHAEDPVDTYAVQATGYAGTGEFKVASYRKPKVVVDVRGEVCKLECRLTFRGMNFFGETVEGKSLHYKAQLVYRGLGDAAELPPFDSDDFRLNTESRKYNHIPKDFDSDDYLAWRLGAMPPNALRMDRVVCQLAAKYATSKAKGAFIDTIPLAAKWLDGKHALQITATLVDHNGREQSATKIIHLKNTEVNESHGGPRVVLEDQNVVAGETVKARLLNGANDTVWSSVLVVQRFVPDFTVMNSRIGSPVNAVNWQARNILYNQIPIELQVNQVWPNQMQQFRGLGVNQLAWNRGVSSTGYSKVTIDYYSFTANQVEFKLDEPGAYKLFAKIHTKAGGIRTREVGCLVVAKPDTPELKIANLKPSHEPGDAIRFAIDGEGRTETAYVSLEDGNGVQHFARCLLTKEAASNRKAEVTIPTTRDITYGAKVAVHWIDEEGRYKVVSKLIKCPPKHRLLTVTCTAPARVAPGEEVTLDVKVKEPGRTRLIVAVYDQSLEGFAENKQPSLHNWLFADNRVEDTSDWDMLSNLLGGLTVDQLLDYCKKSNNQCFQSVAKTKTTSGYILANILRTMGYPIQWSANYRWGISLRDDDKTLFEVLCHHLQYSQERCDWVGGILHISSKNMSHIRQTFGGSYSGHASMNSMHSASAQAVLSHAAPTMPTMVAANMNNSGTVRTNFADTALFTSQVFTDETGRASVTFKMPDSLTKWKVKVVALSDDMRAGQATTGIETWRDLMVWPMLPRFFTMGDEVVVYGQVHNRTDKKAYTKVTLKVNNGEVLGRATQYVWVEANGYKNVRWRFKAGTPGYCELLMRASSSEVEDASHKRLPVMPRTREHHVFGSGALTERTTLRFDVPKDADPESIKAEIVITPSVMMDLEQTLPYLINYPHGCVEQTMSKFYPLLKATEVMTRMKIGDKLQEKVPAFVKAGIKRLLQLQKADGSWGWYANSQTSDIMSAYALMGILGAEKLGYASNNPEKVAQAMNYLETQLSGGANLNTIYCMHVYTMKRALTNGHWATINRYLAGSPTDYGLALVLDMAVHAKKQALADSVAKRLLKQAKERNGQMWWETANFRYWGQNRFEVTAAVLTALVHYDHKLPAVEKAITFFMLNKKGGRWRSTKDTGMIVCALSEYIAKGGYEIANKKHDTVTVFSSKLEKLGSRRIELNRRTKPITLKPVDLRRGKNELKLHSAPGFTAYYRLKVSYQRKGLDKTPVDRGFRVNRRIYWMNGPDGSRELESGDTLPVGAQLLIQLSVNPSSSERKYVMVTSPAPSLAELSDKNYRGSASNLERKSHCLHWQFENLNNTTLSSYYHVETPGEIVIPSASAVPMYETDVYGTSASFVLKVKEK